MQSDPRTFGRRLADAVVHAAVSVELAGMTVAHNAAPATDPEWAAVLDAKRARLERIRDGVGEKT